MLDLTSLFNSDQHILPATSPQHIQLMNHKGITQKCSKLLQVIQPKSKQIDANTNATNEGNNPGMHGPCMDVWPVHTKQSDPINSGHYVQPENHHPWFKNPHRSKPGREDKRNNCRLQKYQTVTYASPHIYSEPYLCPATSVQPAHINQINYSARECAQVHMVKINSGHQNLPDKNSKVLQFASVNQKNNTPMVYRLSKPCHPSHQPTHDQGVI